MSFRPAIASPFTATMRFVSRPLRSQLRAWKFRLNFARPRVIVLSRCQLLPDLMHSWHAILWLMARVDFVRVLELRSVVPEDVSRPPLFDVVPVVHGDRNTYAARCATRYGQYLPVAAEDESASYLQQCSRTIFNRAPLPGSFDH